MIDAHRKKKYQIKTKRSRIWLNAHVKFSAFIPCLILLVLGLLAGCQPKQKISKKSYSSGKLVLNAVELGARGDGKTDNLEAFKYIVTLAQQKNADIYIPAGRFLLSHSFPIRSKKSHVIQDYNGLTVFGDEKKTVVFTNRANCADVFQLNSVKNVTIRSLKIETFCGKSPQQGANGVSITNSGENITIENVTCSDLRYVEKSNYIDGGKAFTIQSNTPTDFFKNIYFTNCSAFNCIYGFGFDSNGQIMNNDNINDIYIDKCTFDGVFRGVTIGTTENMAECAKTPGYTVSVTNSTIRNADIGVFIGRWCRLLLMNNSIAVKKTDKYHSQKTKHHALIVAKGMQDSKLNGNTLKCQGCKESIEYAPAKSSISKVIKTDGNQVSDNSIKD